MGLLLLRCQQLQLLPSRTGQLLFKERKELLLRCRELRCALVTRPVQCMAGEGSPCERPRLWRACEGMGHGLADLHQFPGFKTCWAALRLGFLGTKASGYTCWPALQPGFLGTMASWQQQNVSQLGLLEAPGRRQACNSRDPAAASGSLAALLLERLEGIPQALRARLANRLRWCFQDPTWQGSQYAVPLLDGCRGQQTYLRVL